MRTMIMIMTVMTAEMQLINQTCSDKHDTNNNYHDTTTNTNNITTTTTT